MPHNAIHGPRTVLVEWYYEIPDSQGRGAVHYDRVPEHELGMFCRQLMSVADATDRSICISIGE